MIEGILWMLTYYSREGFDVNENIKSYIESKKFNVKHTVRDTNIAHSPRGLPAPPNPPLSSTWFKYGTLYYSSSTTCAAIPDTW